MPQPERPNTGSWRKTGRNGLGRSLAIGQENAPLGRFVNAPADGRAGRVPFQGRRWRTVDRGAGTENRAPPHSPLCLRGLRDRSLARGGALERPTIRRRCALSARVASSGTSASLPSNADAPVLSDSPTRNAPESRARAPFGLTERTSGNRRADRAATRSSPEAGLTAIVIAPIGAPPGIGPARRMHRRAIADRDQSIRNFPGVNWTQRGKGEQVASRSGKHPVQKQRPPPGLPGGGQVRR